jgi:hypothetical protein
MSFSSEKYTLNVGNLCVLFCQKCRAESCKLESDETC